ncbi:ADP-ribosylation factor-like protein 5B isoform X1 [Megalops cyprinoides]|nr:ADP-ribosylation factor-like protein 5B isoform X1 [Megalops cyprinoides]
MTLAFSFCILIPPVLLVETGLGFLSMVSRKEGEPCTLGLVCTVSRGSFSSVSVFTSALLFTEHKVIIVGLDNAGKTTILYQFLTKEAVHTSPTIGSNVEEISVRKTRFLVWDIGGQESLRASWNSYYCNTEIVILVVDSTDRERLTLTREELHRMLAHEDLQNAAVLVLANKQDMKDSMTAAEISQCLTLSSITGHSWHVQACCALTGEGLPASLDWMRSRVLAS